MCKSCPASNRFRTRRLVVRQREGEPALHICKQHQSDGPVGHQSVSCPGFSKALSGRSALYPMYQIPVGHRSIGRQEDNTVLSATAQHCRTVNSGLSQGAISPRRFVQGAQVVKGVRVRLRGKRIGR